MLLKNKVISVNNLINYNFLFKKIFKHTHDSIVLLTLFEFYYNNFFLYRSYKKLYYFSHFFFKSLEWDVKLIYTINLLIKDMIGLTSMWRLIKNYPTHGQRTHSNHKMCRKNKNLLSIFRLNQFFSHFGVKKRNIYPTLIIAEYTNKLWLSNWTSEWFEAYKLSFKLEQGPRKFIPFDPVSLSKNITTGYTRVGKASNIGKKQKIQNIVTIGVPIFFSRFLFFDHVKSYYRGNLRISDENRKKMGSKRKKNKKKK